MNGVTLKQQQCHELGFKIVQSKLQWNQDIDWASLAPRDDELPIYARDTELFTGTLEEIEIWLRRLQWARNYDKMIKACDAKRRANKEELYRQYRMLNILKNG